MNKTQLDKTLGTVKNYVDTGLNKKSDNGHTHNYAGSSSAGGAATSANKLATSRKIGNADFDGTSNITLEQMGVPNIVILTQAKYDALEAAGKVDPNAYYLISDQLYEK